MIAILVSTARDHDLEHFVAVYRSMWSAFQKFIGFEAGFEDAAIRDSVHVLKLVFLSKRRFMGVS